MKVAFSTLGCRTNQHDTAEMQALLKKEGFSLVNHKEKADVYVVNSCTVTQKSDYSSRLAVRKSLGINDNALIVLTGCYAQNNPEEAGEIPGLSLVLGNANKLEVAQAIKKTLAKSQPWNIPEKSEFHMSDINELREFRTIPVDEFQGKTKAFIKVQTGCDEKCSFCTVARARGRSISDSRENILQNIRLFIKSGYKEITLTGINLGTYGMDSEPPETFSSLVEEIIQLDGNFRVRLSSINPMEIDDHLIELMSSSDKLCPHFHIPLQSGDTSVLNKMRRNYNSAQYLDIVHRIIKKIPNVGLGADVIVGFPGETSEKFENTREMISHLPFSYLHVFSYSGRNGTEAFDFSDSVLKDEKKLRNKELTELAQTKSLDFQKKFLGQTVSILFEEQRDRKTNLLKGHSEHYIPVLAEGDDSLINQIVPVKIQEINEDQVFGCVQS
jgi:threonylcarbamoyladenosine tRNA methylthiotransferase MtaB